MLIRLICPQILRQDLPPFETGSMVGKVSKGTVPPPFLISTILKNAVQRYKTNTILIWFLYSMFHYYVLNKPYGYLSQFTDEGGHPGLKGLLDVAPDVYAVGRLDHDSEGLLLLTNDKKLNKLLLDPVHMHERTYWVATDDIPSEEDLALLRAGVDIQLSGTTYHTRPCSAQLIAEPDLWERSARIRSRKTIPVGWLEISLSEGKNRQVRKMTAAIGHPTLRLIRIAIEALTLGDLKPGEYRSYPRSSIYRLLRLT
jgi:23S rRNA pseudouridine2457 synthase